MPKIHLTPASSGQRKAGHLRPPAGALSFPQGAKQEAPMSPKRKEVPKKWRSWLSTPRLELRPLLNLARGCDPAGKTPPDWPPMGEWLATWKQLKVEIDCGYLPTSMPVTLGLPIRLANSSTIIDLDIFWGFLANRPCNGCWDDLRWLCSQWEMGCGHTLLDPQSAAKALQTQAPPARKRGAYPR